MASIPNSASSKALLVAVFLIGGGALVFGGYGLYARITKPFDSSLLAGIDFEALRARTEEAPVDEVERLKTIDSDEDGLTDYDETYIYATSPYLPDSDSDGATDSEEIARGTDPNCVPGEDCLGVRLVTPDTKISDLFPQFSDSTITLKDKTLQEFRGILLEQGYDATKLEAVSDQELLIFLEEALKLQDQEASGEPAEQVNLDDVRQFLIDLGVPEDEVYALSNTDLLEILNTLQ